MEFLEPGSPEESPCSAAEEDDSEWLCGAGVHGKPAPPEGLNGDRVIVHIDLDCFYAQVEMVRNPELRHKPLGIQQKYLVVTCNYEARRQGVEKMMSVSKAKEKCPQLVLVCGENLTPYREMSYKITELLEEFSPLVERLGFDENFVDITKMVENRLKQMQSSGLSAISVSGHIYNNQTLQLNEVKHVRLAIGSHIAAEMRAALYNRVSLTGCAGIAFNKLLAKLVSGTFKPNQQTVLLPESTQNLMESLAYLTKVPGIGYKTAKRLESLGLTTIRDLQAFPRELLEKEFGVSAAQRIHKFSYGEDDSCVTHSGPPQSLSDEDSFKRCSSEPKVRKKLEELLANLLDRIHKDGRLPYTIRLTIRRFSATNKWVNRESRQCPVPSHLLQKLGTGSYEVIAALTEVLMKLFQKMVDVKMPFHLTLLNVCFSNLKATCTSTKGSIGFYLSPKKSANPSLSQSSQRTECTFNEDKTKSSLDTGHRTDSETDATNSSVTSIRFSQTAPVLLEDIPEQHKSQHLSAFHLPAGIDFQVFSQLPPEIQKELVSSEATVRSQFNSSPKQEKQALQKSVPKSGVFFLQKQISRSFGHSSHEGKPTSPTPQGSDSESLLISPHSQPEVNVPGERDEVHVANCESWPNAENSESTLTEGPTDQKPLQLLLSDPSNINRLQPKWQGPRSNQSSQVVGSEIPSLSTAPGFAQLVGPMDQELTGPSVPFPSHVDPATFSELPAELQEELLAEWKQQKPVSKTHSSTHLGKVKAKKGTKRTLSKPSQSNSLMRYFKQK
ncbi:DNA polymerase iota isoform X2 [Latimeria chalumnae]|uniref:DNA polymerase iota isoform X2 n=1 Tax=Latimeria chalumnae TaxID=7897 RepID=UPI00313D6E84